MKDRPLKILLVSDTDEESLRLDDELRRGGYRPQTRRVDSAADLRAALAEPWDLWLVDYVIPGSGGPMALEIYREAAIDTPMLVISGQMIEEVAVDLMRAGARDFIRKEQRNRLLPIIERELHDATSRHNHRILEEEAIQLAIRNELILQTVGEGIFGIDTEGLHTFVNPAAADLLGYTAEGLRGLPSHSTWHYRRPDGTVYPLEECPICGVLRDGVARKGEEWFVRKDGSLFPAEYIANPITDRGKISGAVVSFVDITQRRTAKQELEQTNRRLLTLSQCSQSLIRIEDEQELMGEICSHLVRFGGYRLTWAGFVDLVQGTLRPSAHAGDGDLLAALWDTQRERWRQQDPALEALELQRIQVVQRIDEPSATSPSAPWRELLVGHRIASSAAIPLQRNQQTLGVLAVYSENAERFCEREIAMLNELADDLSFGIHAIRTRHERDLNRVALEGAMLRTIEAIALTVEKRDPYTAGHQRRVSELSTSIAQHLGMPAVQIEALRLAALIHDIGKIYIPAEILNRPGQLSDNEYALVKTHVEVGHEILSGIEFPWPVAEMVRQHHERLDGSGYPRGLRGEQIMLEARILCVADVVEAISSDRPYRPAYGIEAAVNELHSGNGALYDPLVVASCLKVIESGEFRFD